MKQILKKEGGKVLGAYIFIYSLLCYMEPSEDNKRNLLLFLLILALFVGGSMEFCHGSKYLGGLMFVIIFILMLNLRVTGTAAVKNPFKFPKLLGIAIIIGDLAFNYFSKGGLVGEIGNIDTMVMFLGASLIVSSINNEQLRKVGIFGAYMSLVVVALDVIFGKLHLWIGLLDFYDHYFVTIPSTYLCGMFGMPVHVVGIKTVCIGADLTVKIGGPCSGIVSMFLLTGIIVAYALTENLRNMRGVLKILIVAILIAYVANLARVSALYTFGYLYGYDIMMFWHTHLGWIIFAGVAMAVMWILSKK